MKKFILSFVLTIPLLAHAEQIVGTVVGVSDGDTMTVLTEDKRQVKVRLAEIDAPEKNQDFGTQSKQSLSDLCFKKQALIDSKETDKYGRTIGRVMCQGKDANMSQVLSGMAWAYTQYLTDPLIANAEKTAKDKKLGLWSFDNPTPPWEFRHGKKSNSKPKSQQQISSNENRECGAKRTCKQMSNCAEANFYLKECGLSKLDRDSDGIPCESLCK